MVRATLASGQVENQVGTVRKRFFVPVPKFRSYAELNAWLEDRCRAWARTSRHPELRDRTVLEVFETERPHLVPYAGPFDGFHAVPAARPSPVGSNRWRPAGTSPDQWRTRSRSRKPASSASTATAIPSMPARSASRWRVSHVVAIGPRPMANAHAAHVAFRQDGKAVGRHERASGRGHAACGPLHGIPVLLRKPGALRSEPCGRHWFETQGERPVP